MKNSIVLLGMAVLVFNLTTAANTSKAINKTVTIATEDQGALFSTENNPLEKRNFAPVEDQAILNPAAVIGTTYEKSIEEIIAENNQITEDQITDEGVFYFEAPSIENIIQENNKIIESQDTAEIRPLYLERTIEDQIAEDNAIIESNVANILEPLDFETINKKSFTMKQNNKLVGMN
ncbi:hypothetical protein [Flavobacterium sp.]|uniref:hypothetical protein n=1 Tax=Flavobacterium sp. TaxID=239 RepID=UPI00263428C1|nr:hypothetical protein [Flavobacterium sp.]